MTARRHRQPVRSERCQCRGVEGRLGFEPTTRGSKVSSKSVRRMFCCAFLSMPREVLVHWLACRGTDCHRRGCHRGCQPDAPMGNPRTSSHPDRRHHLPLGPIFGTFEPAQVHRRHGQRAVGLEVLTTSTDAPASRRSLAAVWQTWCSPWSGPSAARGTCRLGRRASSASPRACRPRDREPRAGREVRRGGRAGTVAPRQGRDLR